ncbi:ABC-type transport auxiliary lipoprotein family protein [Marinobacterium mangrovicola]|uniref:Cholesterol transport system auxiliary component n=1 Tax=Marinobacterium mangrovicola TaxID=1476959 RepID=A0A4R1GML5_9GAMM|nr:ABC-type transport auxiliary lipoprotein family protein [Marinobacterium mangrovicola]TCK05652.1 cholesterol transport system auxiliary component [Marinobacterium mangrovicola]
MLRSEAPKKVNKGLVLGLCLVVISAMGGCSLLPESDPVQSWTLQPAAKQDLGPVELSDLRVLRPQAQDLLSGRYLLVVPEEQPVSVYKGNRWSANVPTLWRDYLVHALQSDSRFAHISSDSARIDARYELVSRLDAFQSEYRDGEPVAVMRGYLQLIDSDSRALIAERAIELDKPAAGTAVSAVVDAFSALMADAGEEIKTWLLRVTPKD